MAFDLSTATPYEEESSGGFDLSTATPIGDIEPEESTIMSRAKERFSKVPNKGFMPWELEDTAFVGGGMAAATAADIALTGIGKVAGAVTPDFIKENLKYAGQELAKSQTGKAVLGSLDYWGKKYDEYIPEDMKARIEAAGGYAAVAPLAPYAKPGLSAAKNAAKFIPKTTKEIIGKTTGAGPGAVDEAIQGGEQFVKAMRGQITGTEIVDNAKKALQVIKDNRAAAYQGKLAEISALDGVIIDKNPIYKHLGDLMKRYNAKITPDGTIDTSKVAMGVKGRKDIAEVIDSVKSWDDFSPTGMDTLKRQLADFYSESSQARQFVTSIENNVANSIKAKVPAYAEMTKGYAEATSLIKDIESNLMMRKQGISGRITADQTLRRLTSAMRENFELRRELVNALDAEGAQDVAAQVAGYAMSQGIPRGLIGTLSAGATGYLAYMNPKFWPLLAASSPRVMGEFLNAYGKAKRALAKLPGAEVPLDRMVRGFNGMGGLLEKGDMPPLPPGRYYSKPTAMPSTEVKSGVTVGTPYGEVIPPRPIRELPPGQGFELYGMPYGEEFIIPRFTSAERRMLDIPRRDTILELPPGQGFNIGEVFPNVSNVKLKAGQSRYPGLSAIVRKGRNSFISSRTIEPKGVRNAFKKTKIVD